MVDSLAVSKGLSILLLKLLECKGDRYNDFNLNVDIHGVQVEITEHDATLVITKRWCAENECE